LTATSILESTARVPRSKLGHPGPRCFCLLLLIDFQPAASHTRLRLLSTRVLAVHDSPLRRVRPRYLGYSSYTRCLNYSIET